MPEHVQSHVESGEWSGGSYTSTTHRAGLAKRHDSPHLGGLACWLANKLARSAWQ